MAEMASHIEGSCEYAIMDSQEEVILQLEGQV
jgi:hypothetical protein